MSNDEINELRVEVVNVGRGRDCFMVGGFLLIREEFGVLFDQTASCAVLDEVVHKLNRLELRFFVSPSDREISDRRESEESDTERVREIESVSDDKGSAADSESADRPDELSVEGDV